MKTILPATLLGWSGWRILWKKWLTYPTKNCLELKAAILDKILSMIQIHHPRTLRLNQTHSSYLGEAIIETFGYFFINKHDSITEIFIPSFLYYRSTHAFIAYYIHTPNSPQILNDT